MITIAVASPIPPPRHQPPATSHPSTLSARESGGVSDAHFLAVFTAADLASRDGRKHEKVVN